jgi:predicted dehydrogenase
MSIAALKAGKHVMCTVPMALSIQECRQIVELVSHTGLRALALVQTAGSGPAMMSAELPEGWAWAS